MSRFRAWTYGTGLTAMALGATLAGCTADANGGGGGPPYASGGYGGAGSAPASSGGGVQLVEVDSNQTLAQTQPDGQSVGGQGVGVFTQYQEGGHWTVWWTCDTAITGLSCDFAVDVSVASGAITNVASQLTEAGASPVQSSPNEVSATTVTTSAIDSITFDTAPGATITLDAKLSGNEDGAFLFFVQDGKVNGGYQGTVSDPLMLEPSSP
jgi:hypothetical protein